MNETGLVKHCLFVYRRIDGRTDWVAIENASPVDSGERLLLWTDMMRPLTLHEPSSTVTLIDISSDVVEVKGLAPGSEAVIYSAAPDVPYPVFEIKAAPVNPVS